MWCTQVYDPGCSNQYESTYVRYLHIDLWILLFPHRPHACRTRPLGSITPHKAYHLRCCLSFVQFQEGVGGASSRRSASSLLRLYRPGPTTMLCGLWVLTVPTYRHPVKTSHSATRRDSAPFDMFDLPLSGTCHLWLDAKLQPKSLLGHEC